MASSSEVMELDVPPPEEDSAATSDAGGGAAIPCWAEKVEATKSTHDREEILRSLCRRYRIREEEYRPFCAKEGWGPCKTMPEGSNAVCVYEDMLEAGVRFPLHDFYAEYLRHYSIAPSQLTPNACVALPGRLLAAMRLCRRPAGGGRVPALLQDVRPRVQATGVVLSRALLPEPAPLQDRQRSSR
ncbi:hypothetical protein BAE44_0015630 [Dichanthelium oligosanthes]|uniref:Transposase (putative) gypsy type domain-containing protein n=1 Tax=Dichanthelium oligosanthes TaxID=888268 RepID=A0A1E5VE70_9POAL|nr:hypothetical protein BAE44_0015630 [Dichanthelium oligosanthes]